MMSLPYAAALVLLACVLSTPAVAGQSLISSHEEMYPRAVLIGHLSGHTGDIVASATSFEGGGHEDIFVSHDNGATFAIAGTVTDPAFAKGLCCGGLYELPQAVGALPAGTLLWAGSVGGDTPAEPMQIRIYQSSDEGAHWSYLSNCATGAVPRSGGGLWEPDFAIAGDGRLVCYYSDETRAGHSQILTSVASADGVTWSVPRDVVVSATQADRPGMASVIKTPDGNYVMSFEMCGPLNCATFIKTSADGLDWSPTDGHGTAVALADGTTFWHTPVLAWGMGPAGSQPQLLLQGQILTRNGAPVTGNGATLFFSTTLDGSGPWQSFTAPTRITMPSGTAGNYCQNYSSPLLVLGDGHEVLGLASDLIGGVCKTYINVSALSGATLSGGDISANAGSSATGVFHLTATGSFGDTFALSVAAPNLPGDISLSDTQLVLGQGQGSDLHVTVKPTATASISEFPGGGVIALASLLVFVAPRRRKVVLAVAAAGITLSGCGGSGGGTSSAPAPTTTSYAATLTATSTRDASVTASLPFTITVTRPG